MKLKRLLSILIIACLAMTLFAGCTPKSTEPTSTKEKEIVLKFEHQNTEKPERAEFFDRMAENYTKLHPNIKIEITKSTFKDANNAILTALSANQPFDIFQPMAGPGDTKIWLEKDAILDLTSYLNANNGEWKNTLRSGVIESVTYGDGKIYNIPLYIDTTPLNYHKEIFDKDKVVPAKNKEEFFNLCEKFKAEGLIAFQLHGSMMDDFLAAIALQFEAKYNINPFDVVQGKVAFTDPWFKDSLSIMKEMYVKGYLPKNFWTIGGTEGRMAYSTGKMPMKFGYYWDVDTHKDMGMPYENQAVASLPNFTGSDNIKLYKQVGPSTYMVSKKCANPEAAVDFLKYMTNVENQDDMAYKYFGRYPNGMPVVNKDVKLSDYAQKYLDDISSGIGTTFSPTNVSLKYTEVITAQLPLFMEDKITLDQIAAEFDKLRSK